MGEKKLSRPKTSVNPLPLADGGRVVVKLHEASVSRISARSDAAKMHVRRDTSSARAYSPPLALTPENPSD